MQCTGICEVRFVAEANFGALHIRGQAVLRDKVHFGGYPSVTKTDARVLNLARQAFWWPVRGACLRTVRWSSRMLHDNFWSCQPSPDIRSHQTASQLPKRCTSRHICSRACTRMVPRIPSVDATAATRFHRPLHVARKSAVVARLGGDT